MGLYRSPDITRLMLNGHLLKENQIWAKIWVSEVQLLFYLDHPAPALDLCQDTIKINNLKISS